jgi:Bacterial protein of unknown function (DUF899)
MTTHKVVKHDEWLKARRRHLAKEKEFTRLRDQLSRERRAMPWELVRGRAREPDTQRLGRLGVDGVIQAVPDDLPMDLDVGRA